MLTFEPIEHQYFWDGDPVVNVTRVLEPFYDFTHINPSTLETARQEGVAIHKMVELEIGNDLDEGSLPDWMRGRLEAWRRFVRDTQFNAILTEQKVYNTMFRYAGTLDLFGRMGNFHALIDIKRSFASGKGVIGFRLPRT